MTQGTATELQKKTPCGGTPWAWAHRTVVSWLTRHFRVDHGFLLHSLAGSLSEIPQRFFSSSLPPEFAAGRCAATFIPAPAVA
jgi:hypothetical protein